MIYKEFKERIHRELPIENYIGTYVPLKKVGKRFIGLCPFHKEKTPSFHVNPEGYYYCFGCKATGDVIRFAKDYHRVDFTRACEILSEFSGIPLEKGDNKAWEEKEKKKQELFRLNQKVSQFFQSCLQSPQGATAQEYLNSRGLGQEIWKKFSIGYAPPGFQNLRGNVLSNEREENLALELGVLKKNENGHVYDFFRGRITFPIFDAQGRILGFTARALPHSEEAKYINSPNSLIYDKSSQFYNIYFALEEIRRQKAAVVVEGVLDAIGFYTKGIRNTIAPLGTSFTEKHAKFLKNIAETVFLVMDGDEAGKKGAMRAAEYILKEGLSCKVVELNKGEDPFDLSLRLEPKELKELLENYKKGFSFLIQMSLKGIHSQSDLEDRKKASLSLLELASHFPRSIDQELILQEGSRILGISLDTLKKEFSNPKGKIQYAKTDNIESQEKIKKEVKEVSKISKKIQDIERKIIAKIIYNKELLQYNSKIWELDFVDEVSCHVWEWILTRVHMGESFQAVDILSTESLPDFVIKEIGNYLFEEEESINIQEDIHSVFEDMLIRREIFLYKEEMDNLTQLLNWEQNYEQIATDIANCKTQINKREEYLRKKVLLHT